MGARTRGIVFALTVLTIAVVGLATLSAIRAPDQASWPDRVAVIGLDESDPRRPVRFLAVADPVRHAVAVVPSDAVVEIPGSGFLRAYHAWRLGRAPLTRATLGRLFGVDVPFAVWGEGEDFETLVRGFTGAEAPSGRLEDFRRTLEDEALNWPLAEVTGERREGEQGTFLIPDPQSVARAAGPIGGLGTRVFVDPTSVDGLVQVEPVADQPDENPPPEPSPEPPPPDIDPSTIAVEVLNGGNVDMAATRTADALKARGYNVVRIADHRPQDRPQSFVYFRSGGEAKARQVGEELGYPVESLPSGFTMKQAADVLVVLGHDARA